MPTREAETRILRVIVIVFGIAALAFLGLESGSIITQSHYLQPAWHTAAILAVFGIPPVAALIAGMLPLVALRRLLRGYAVLFLAALGTYPLALVDGPLPLSSSPWPIAATALATTVAAISLRPALAWGYLLLAPALVGLARFLASGGETGTNAAQLAFFWVTFSALFTVLSRVIISNARAVDAAAAAARAAAASSASTIARGREQARLDALVHDEIIATLYSASLGDPTLAPAIRRQAGRALAELERIRGRAGSATDDVTADQLVSRIRAVALGIAPGIRFDAHSTRSAQVPADVAAAFAEATAEAVRNSSTHAGPASRSATVELSDEGASVVIDDDGVGFLERDVAQHRLGVRVSIRGRLDALDGGSASIRSQPGRGTTVTLEWNG